ncbi:TPA: hypothetical protein U2C55_001414, partial [Streptococcus suis]|nr:hypothetical protein [Streptococcus suis]
MQIELKFIKSSQQRLRLIFEDYDDAHRYIAPTSTDKRFARVQSFVNARFCWPDFLGFFWKMSLCLAVFQPVAP